jgi:hypothetical protein
MASLNKNHKPEQTKPPNKSIMKRALWIALLISLAAFNRTQAQVTPLVNFQFTLNPTAWDGGPVSGWTNVYGDPSHSVITVTDPVSGITISSVATANWYSSYGTCAETRAGDSVGPTYFPPQIMLDHWYQYSTGSQTQYNSSAPQLELSGLNKDSSYILRMTGSNIYSWDDANPVQYTVAGASVYPSQLLNTDSNTTQGVTFQHVYPDSNGDIRVYVNTTSSSQDANICGLQVISGSANVGSPTVAFTIPTNGTILPEGTNLNITATASETGASIAKVVFYADTTEIAQVNNAPYTFTWNDPDPGSYTLTAIATDNVGTVNSASINIAVDPLNYFWSTTGNIATPAPGNFVGTVDSNALAFRTKNIERMRISAIGNVGIGTDSPTAQLHTTGTVRLAGLTNDSTKTRVLVTDSSGNMFYRNASSLTGRWLYASGTGTVYDSLDNVAIGTSNPQGYKFAVNGTAIFTKVKVKTAGTWPDYVFEKGYGLPDLPALEKYIKANKHLPGILSAKEASERGIDVGENQATLLKKIEEMTLLLIRQDKQLTEQQAQLDSQQKEIDELKALIKAKK